MFNSGLPLSVSEDKDFIEFLRILKPTYKPPSRYNLSTKLLNNAYDDSLKTIAQRIKDADTVGILMDT